MSLHMVIGPMCSGKTTYLLNEYEKNKDDSIMICPSIDNRTRETGLWTHDGKTFSGRTLYVDKLRDAFEMIAQYNHILINEVQFIENVSEDIVHIVERYNKTVHISGLDGDFNRKPFPFLSKLIPYADTVIKLTAKCDICGERAPFTKKKTANNNKIEIGGKDIYSPRCRNHYVSDNV